MKKTLNYLVMFIALFAVVACGNNSTKPEEVAKSFASAFVDNKPEEIVKLIDTTQMDPEELKLVNDKLSSMVALASTEMKKQGVTSKDFIIESVEYEGENKAFVKAYWKVGDRQENANLDLIKKDGKWFVELK